VKINPEWGAVEMLHFHNVFDGVDNHTGGCDQRETKNHVHTHLGSGCNDKGCLASIFCGATYLGPDDIDTMPLHVFLHDILGITFQDGPINLLCPEFNLTAAKTDSTIIIVEINMKVIRLANPSVIDHLFNQL
jgi:hypothetical protein